MSDDVDEHSIVPGGHGTGPRHRLALAGVVTSGAIATASGMLSGSPVLIALTITVVVWVTGCLALIGYLTVASVRGTSTERAQRAQAVLPVLLDWTLAMLGRERLGRERPSTAEDEDAGTEPS